MEHSEKQKALKHSSKNTDFSNLFALHSDFILIQTIFKGR